MVHIVIYIIRSSWINPEKALYEFYEVSKIFWRKAKRETAEKGLVK